MQPTIESKPQALHGPSGMAKWFRRIHLWLSVPFGVIITLVCFSGAMLVYEQEITQCLRPQLYYVEAVGPKPLPLDSLMKRVQATLPDTVQATGITVQPDPKRTWQVSLSAPRRASVYVDPYTGQVMGRNERLPFFDTMFHLHRWLLGPSQSASGGLPAGKLLVGAGTLVLVIVLLTGILMWLSNRRKPLRKSLAISVTKGWHRFWHDLHVAGGIYATVFLLAIALTGLTWSFGWYRTGFYALFGVEQQAGGGPGSHGTHGQRASAHGGAHHGGRGDAQHAARGGQGRHGGAVSAGDGACPYAHWQQVFEQLAQTHAGYRQITLSDGTAGVVPKGRRSLRAADTYGFDPQTGRITDRHPYAESDEGTRVRSAVYMVHTGSWLGGLTRLVNFLAALLGATLPLTGYYLWIRRLLKRRQCRKAA
ncbi:MAG: PepSY-associated TM helix domain-containing protein [Alloprevotella sp.]